jgi:hypothetical protein
MDGASFVKTAPRRERWSKAVSDRRERLLSFGSSTEAIPAPDHLGLDWQSFVQKLDDPGAVLRCLVLANTASVALFTDELPLLYRALRRTTVAKPVVSRRGLIGSPLWSRTIYARAASGGDETLYVVGSTARSSDVPENRGLVSCLSYLDAMITSIARKAGGEERLPRAIREVGREARDGLRLPALRDLPVEPLLSVRSRTAMSRSRFTTFERIADLALALRATEDASRSDLSTSLAAAGWLSPLSDDDLFELLVLTRAVDAIVSRWGEPSKVWPISHGDTIAEWALPDDVRLKLYFNTTPTALRQTSRYLSTSRNYVGMFNASVRRPDLVVALTRGSASSHTLVEVKNPAEDSDDYRRESLYKCFGYLYDFGEVLDKEHGPDVCFLVLPDKLTRKAEADDRVAVLSGDQGTEFADRLLKRLESAVANLGP